MVDCHSLEVIFNRHALHVQQFNASHLSMPWSVLNVHVLSIPHQCLSGSSILAHLLVRCCITGQWLESQSLPPQDKWCNRHQWFSYLLISSFPHINLATSNLSRRHQTAQKLALCWSLNMLGKMNHRFVSNIIYDWLCKDRHLPGSGMHPEETISATCTANSDPRGSSCGPSGAHWCLQTVRPCEPTYHSRRLQLAGWVLTPSCVHGLHSIKTALYFQCLFALHWWIQSCSWISATPSTLLLSRGLRQYSYLVL